MLGAIVGDTVGSIYEFNNTKDHNFEMFTNQSGYTDDSIMTMAVAYWLLKDPRFEKNKCHIEYYIDEDEAVFNILFYGALLFLWLIVIAIISLIRSI